MDFMCARPSPFHALGLSSFRSGPQDETELSFHSWLICRSFCLCYSSPIFSSKTGLWLYRYLEVCGIIAFVCFSILHEFFAAFIVVWALIIQEGEFYRFSTNNGDSSRESVSLSFESKDYMSLEDSSSVVLSGSLPHRCMRALFWWALICSTLSTLDAFQRVILETTTPMKGDHYQTSFGAQIYLECEGTGALTVVFETALSTPRSAEFKDQFATVLAAEARACWYDRPGYGRSQSLSKPRTHQTFEVIYAVVRETLAAAGEAGPFVWVAHSLGGPMARTFALHAPEDVVGLLLLDTSSEDMSTASGDAQTWVNHSVSQPSVALCCSVCLVSPK
jgi:hypothetical protein